MRKTYVAGVILLLLVTSGGGRGDREKTTGEVLRPAAAGQKTGPYKEQVKPWEDKGRGAYVYGGQGTGYWNLRQQSNQGGSTASTTAEGRAGSCGPGTPGSEQVTGRGTEAGEGSTERLSVGRGTGVISRGTGNGVNIGTFKVSAYTAGYESTQKKRGDPAYGLTATGSRATQGRTVAADWKVLKPGTVLRIEGLEGFYVVEDKGSGIHGKELDLYFNDVTDAIQWGVQSRQVYVVE